MNALKPMPTLEDAPNHSGTVPIDRAIALPADINDKSQTRNDKSQTRSGRRLFAAAAALLLFGSLAIGMWQHLKLNAETETTSAQRRDFVPNMRVAEVRSSGEKVTVSLPGTTEAFEQANI